MYACVWCVCVCVCVCVVCACVCALCGMCALCGVCKERSTLSHLLPGHSEGGVEPLLKGVAGLEDIRQQEVHEGPELREVVLGRKERASHDLLLLPLRSHPLPL